MKLGGIRRANIDTYYPVHSIVMLWTPHMTILQKKVFGPKSETFNGPERPFRAVGHLNRPIIKSK